MAEPQRPTFVSPDDDPYAPPTPPSEVDRRTIRLLVAVVGGAAAGLLLAWAITGDDQYAGMLMLATLFVVGFGGRWFRHNRAVFWWNVRVAVFGDRPGPLRYGKKATEKELARRAGNAAAEQQGRWIASGLPDAGRADAPIRVTSTAPRSIALTPDELAFIEDAVNGPMLVAWGGSHVRSRREEKALEASLTRRGLVQRLGSSIAIAPDLAPVLGVAMLAPRVIELRVGSGEDARHLRYALAGERAVRLHGRAGDPWQLTALPAADAFTELRSEFAGVAAQRGAPSTTASVVLDVADEGGSGSADTHLVDLVGHADGTLTVRPLDGHGVIDGLDADGAITALRRIAGLAPDAA